VQHNHIAELDDAAEAIAGRLELPVGRRTPSLASYLESRHGVTVLIDRDRRAGIGNAAPVRWPHANAAASPSLDPGQQAFQLATQIAILNWTRRSARSSTRQIHQRRSRGLARIGLRNYFAGALILPYGRFPQRGGACRYDIELLQSPVRVVLKRSVTG